MTSSLTETDLARLRDAIAVSKNSVEHGNHPFGAVLVDAAGTVVLEAENTVVTGNDCTGHAETNLVRLAWQAFGPEKLAEYSLYTSCEPCAMCSGAIYWSGISRMVFAMSEAELGEITGDHVENPTMSLTSSVVLNSGQREIVVLGPALSAEAREAHAGFWS
ncbi:MULTISPECIES: nucleoside deaminase [Subtercola]|uniref:Nucleoside deaminase n=1 Tax=Subtercola vilae TaxID=2056433 RepID=A0A4T2C9Q3_9MICO|nr:MULTISPECIES: nucleoside deaminase [Subtercola]MEA9983992.1 nucleoside deaminase [Subtercola sp. RTI3]TIH40940.1 nucleoside deaminase [Subtercola vilae]